MLKKIFLIIILASSSYGCGLLDDADSSGSTTGGSTTGGSTTGGSGTGAGASLVPSDFSKGLYDDVELPEE